MESDIGTCALITPGLIFDNICFSYQLHFRATHLSNNKKENDKPRVDSTLSKGLSVLEVLTENPNGKGVTELSRELELTKSNAFRLLRTLSTLGYVSSGEDKKYRATMKVWQLGQRVVENMNLQPIARPHLAELSQKTGETVYLAVRDGLSVVYIDKIESTKPIRSFTPKGGSAPIHCVGTGKALLSAEYDVLRETVRHHLTRYTPITITSLRKLDADMEATRERGYAIDRGEYRDRILSFASVIRLPNGRPVAALGVSAPDVNLEGNRIEEICTAVHVAANAVSAALKDT